MKLEYPMKLSFVLEEENNVLNKVFVVEGDTQWTELIIKFADFLNAQYGYDVKEKIVFLSDYGYHDQWTVVGERTITTAAYKLAKEIDEKQEELDFEE
jgi:predicted RNA-binding protein with PIN domain